MDILQWHKQVPRSPLANLDYRLRLLRLADKDHGLRKACIETCSEDLLFYVNTFVFTYNPHYKQKLWPWCTFPFQDDALIEMNWCIENSKDACILKSREVGASWLSCIVMDWRFLFRPNERFFMISRKEHLVDRPGDSDSLFWKLDFIHDRLPLWMNRQTPQPMIKRMKLAFENTKNSSTIIGDSTTEASGVGGRCTAMFIDEFSRMDKAEEVRSGSRDTTRCRIFNFTIYGDNNAAHKVAHDKHVRQIRMPWYSHPHKNKGLYRYDEHQAKKIWYVWDPVQRALAEIPNPAYEFPPDYDFYHDGKLRSVAYDEAWRGSGENKRSMAQNWDMDWQGSHYQFFDSISVRDYMKEFCTPPMIQGDLHYDPHTLEPIDFLEVKGGPIQLWCRLDINNKPPVSQYASGIDVSYGQGSSNSVMSVGCCKTGHKVMEFATPIMRPEDFANKCVAIMRWLYNGQMCWEIPGPGISFGRQVMEIGYNNIYLMKIEHIVAKKSTDRPGWVTNIENKRDLLELYRGALARRVFINRSEEALKECLSYIHLPTGKIVHSATQGKEDPTGAEAAHGDRVIADALCYKMCKNASPSGFDKETVKVRPGSIAWLREIKKQNQKIDW